MDRPRPIVLQDLLDRDLHLPVCPVVFIRLMDALQDDDNTDLTKILSSDPALMIKVLRVSNSAFYGLTRQVRSINEAILRVGITQIWSIASALKAKELFQTAGGEWSQLSGFLWEHALTTGEIVRSSAKRVRTDGTDEIFTAALLHDLGKSVLQQVDPQYAALCTRTPAGPELVAQEQALFGTTHAKLGGELLKHWNLPANLVALVGGHHDDPLAEDELQRSRYILALANELTRSLVIAKDDTPPTLLNPPAPHLTAFLTLDEAACIAIVTEAQQAVAVLKKF